MATIYVITGGGQRIKQDQQNGILTTYQVFENSDWPEKSGLYASDTFTGPIWAQDLEALQKCANEWAGKNIELKELKQ